jgi:carbon-monoxide dehydrogenase medium subunit
MKPAPFVYHAPESLPEALGLLQEFGDDAKVLAGGQSLIPVMNMRLSQPAHLIDVCRIDQLAGVDVAGGISIGSTTRQADVHGSPEVAATAPIIQTALGHVGHPANRSRGTFGGSLAHADPAAELPAVVVALDGRMVIDGPRGQRVVAADEFFETYFTTVIEPEEILTRIEIPAAPPGRRRAWSFLEIGRRHGDFAMVGVAFVAVVGQDDRVESARLVVLGVADVPYRAGAAESVLVGSKLTDEAIAAAVGETSTDGLEPPSDLHASAQYRIDVTRVLAKRAVTSGADRLKGLTDGNKHA